ncbi:MAG: spore coat protein [Herbinix sp.]|jgi:similar to spore coat protein|nr:spore coat protein [Herbinix sp.]
MANIIQNIAGMGNMTEQVIASDFLIASKSAIKSYAAALAEATTPEVTNTLRGQLDDAINTHGQITTYMMNKGYYNAYDPAKQFAMDRQASDTVMKLGQTN